MAFTTEEKFKYAVIFEQTISAVTVRRRFKKMFTEEASPASTIRSWHKKLITTGSSIPLDKGSQARTNRKEEKFYKSLRLSQRKPTFRRLPSIILSGKVESLDLTVLMIASIVSGTSHNCSSSFGKKS